MNAFDKTKLGDTYYFQPITSDQRKDLKNLAGTLGADETKTHRKVLKRKAAMLLLEGMGFKDDWRKKVAPAAVAAGPAPTTVKVKDVAGAEVTVLLPPPPAPPAPELLVQRKFNSADLTDGYWTNYVNSLVAYPELKPDEWKVTKELKKMAVDKLNNNIFNSVSSSSNIFFKLL